MRMRRSALPATSSRFGTNLDTPLALVSPAKMPAEPSFRQLAPPTPEQLVLTSRDALKCGSNSKHCSMPSFGSKADLNETGR
jgi:hypothetical protein